MEKIYGLTLEELALGAIPSLGSNYAPERVLAEEEKAKRFADSVLGRELLAWLPGHHCDRGCDTFQLVAAEFLATSRPRNKRALGMLLNRLNYHLKSASKETATFMAEQGWDLRQFLSEWISVFFLRAVDVLHGEIEPQELFGTGYLYEQWLAYEKAVKDTN